MIWALNRMNPDPEMKIGTEGSEKGWADFAMNYQVKSDGPVSSCGGWRRWHCIDLTNQLEESVLDHCSAENY